jgi:serine/threonine protein kinase
VALALRRYRKTLLASGLMLPDELRAFEGALPRGHRPKTPEGLAQALIDAEKLTPFQAAEIAAGRITSLVLGNYVVLDRIGAGGMGQVFKAWHRRMQRVVALKTLPNEAAAGEDSIARFRREILSAAQLSHPNIVAAYDADVAAGVHFLVMEYVAGQNLADFVRQHGPRPVAQAVKYILDAARGLAYAHSRGIIHRDVKPSNLIVNEADVVKVLDLGLARPTSGLAGAELTSPGDVVGTLEYMAPEQAAGSAAVDSRADIYGLGCTLYRLVTGELPYRGGSPIALIAAHREQKIPSLRATRDDVPRSLDAVFKRMVAKEAAERYASMDEVIEALEKLRITDRTRSARPYADRPAVLTPPISSTSGDDIALAPTASGPLPQANHGASSNLASTSPAAKPVAARPVISPALALLTLLAALAGLTSLSWFDSTDNGGRTSTGEPQQGATDYSSASAWQRSCAESLGVPVTLTNSLGMRFVLIPPDESRRGTVEAVGVPFYFATCELTVAQYRQFLAATGGGGGRTTIRGATRTSGDAHVTLTRQGDRHAAIDLTADDAERYCLWLSERERANYRLPTDVEFAHACRAGSAGVLWFDPNSCEPSRFAWYQASSGNRTHQVGLLEANPLGLHDLLGNAPEWCRLMNTKTANKLSAPPTSHALVGGSWLSPIDELTSSQSGALSPARTGGLRLVLELPLEARWPR